ncbi:hypothetical protein HDZ31DRAFT_68553 [Schizophyllum fasciatum]
MFAAALTLLSGLALANAAGLRYGATSEYGQNQGDFILHETANPSGYVLGGSVATNLSISATLTNGELWMHCPYEGYQAVLVPVAGADPAAYTVQFINSFEGLPAGTLMGKWATTEDRTGLGNDNFTKVINLNHPEDVGRWDVHLNNDKYDGVNTIEWVNKSYYDHGVYRGWFIVLDNANDVTC